MAPKNAMDSAYWEPHVLDEYVERELNGETEANGGPEALVAEDTTADIREQTVDALSKSA